ncbi:hypothetical protein [Streptomyces sp. PAN_FS17]|uniref:hypothetical protein n=1 Tax=Streptomyces TaxID=1883 RepID=UPI0008966430|nr:hypothetical protein [Streptomyces sp. PAN_FS17]SEC97596.1 hypothetical protein SAMN05216482_5397 [Streptomyces sp. PAN_FS17]
MRRMRVAAVCGAALVTAVGGVAPAAGVVRGDEAVRGAGAVRGAEAVRDAVAVRGAVAGLAYHGSADIVGDRVDVRFTPHNHGPAAVPDSVVRIRWSQPLEEGQTLPARCAPEGDRAVRCRVGRLGAHDSGERIGLRVRLREAPSEVLLEFDPVGSDGTVDESRAAERQRVLVLDTGDKYYF